MSPSRPWPHLADAADIIQWSDRMNARSELPRLVRRLISQNNDQVAILDMRSGEGVGVSGYDGFVRAAKATPFVPEGDSVWEIGTEKGPGTKASKDYRKRTRDPKGVDPAKTTFVALTSRRWPTKSAWVAARRAEGLWADVRAFDVDDIELALESSPPVHFWFSEVVGKPAASVQTLEDWWMRFSSRTSPTLTPSFVLSGRSDSAFRLLSLLEEDRRFTTVSAKSIDDVLAFVASAIMAAPEDTRDDLLARALVVKDSTVLRQLDYAARLLILLPFDATMRREAELVQTHHVIFLSIDNSPSDIDLPPIDHDAFLEALRGQGLDEQRAEELARAAHKSLLAFQRLAAITGRGPVPAWSSQLATLIVRRAWLAGAWNADRSGDLEVLSELFGQDYNLAEPQLTAATMAADPILTSIGGVWAVVSPQESWEYCQRHLTNADLQALETTIQTVLGAVDPALELESDKRWMAAIYGKSRIHSRDIRKGLATTLCLLGCNGDSVTLGAGRSARTWAESVVSRLLQRANADTSGQLWTSLTDVLPLLAEAAPDVFLSAVQQGTAGDNPLLSTLFSDAEGDMLTLSSPHTGILWALELLAWSPEYFALATDQLARLVEIDPGGRLSNRPATSLRDIFRPWLAQTGANTEARLAALDGIVSRHDRVGWSLLLALLPEHSAVGTHTYAPRFRTWKPSGKKVTPSEYWDFVAQVGRRLIDIAGKNPSRWIELAPHLADMPPDLRSSACQALREVPIDALSAEERTSLWNALTDLVRSHQAYADANWAMPAEAREEIEAVSRRFLPSDTVSRFGWLFTSQMPELGAKKHADSAEYNRQLSQLREEAVIEIEREHGLPGLLALASKMEKPGILGAAVASHTSSTVQPGTVVPLLDADDAHEVAFATGYVRKASGGAMSWLEPHIRAMSDRPLVQARLLLCSDDLEQAWNAAASLGGSVDAAYWREFSCFGRGSDFGPVNEVATKMVEHGRPADALCFLSLYSHQNRIKIEPALVVRGFEALLAGGDDEIWLLSSYDISRLLKVLRESGMDEDQLAMLEWRLLPASDSGIGRTSLALHRKLSHDPAFFVEIVSLCYKPRRADQANQVAPNVAQNACRLLDSWTQVPGSDVPGGPIDAELLSTWVAEARRLLQEADRAEIGEHIIGAVLAHAPQDADGTWPPLPVRDLIEQSASRKLLLGLRTEALNMRGVTSRGPAEGGSQERALAKKYGDWADALKNSWPRSAALLRSLSRDYEAAAKMYDEEAQRFREGLEG